MNTKTFLAFLAVLPLATGCVINGGKSRQQPGDVTFSWTFADKGCGEHPEVQSVRVVIPGEALQNDGVYPCTSNGYPGIVLHDFAPKTYSFTLDALGYSGERLFTASGNFTVNGNIMVTVDLTPVGSPSSWAYLTWTFPPDPSVTKPCYDRGIAYVDVQIDSLPLVRYNCDDGVTTPGVKTHLLSPGSHTIKLWAVDTTSYVYYSTLTTSANAPTSQQYSLQWAVGGTSIKWQLTNGSTGLTCQQAVVDTLYATFVDVQTGKALYGVLNDPATWDRIDGFCTKYSFLYWSYLPPGTYQVYLRADGSGGTYDSNFQAPPQITIKAGEFPGEAQAQVVTMYRVN